MSPATALTRYPTLTPEPAEQHAEQHKVLFLAACGRAPQGIALFFASHVPHLSSALSLSPPA